MGSKLCAIRDGALSLDVRLCPLSENRREIDFMYANERRVDIGIGAPSLRKGDHECYWNRDAGGDPMMAAERSIQFVEN